MKKELLALLDYWEREKGIDRNFLIDSLEKGLLTVYRKKAGLPADMTVRISPDSGELVFIVEGKEVPPPSFPWERIAAQTAKQVLIQKIREAEKNAIFQEFKKMEGSVMSGRIERFDENHIVLSFGKTEGLLPQHHKLPSDHLRVGDIVKVLVLEVRKPNKGNYQVIVSRTHPDFVRRLLENEIPELQEGIIEIKSLARFPGDLTKIAVHSLSDRVDSVGTCIGDKALRIRNISRELAGERIEIIAWNPDPAAFVMSSLSPARGDKIMVDEEKKEAVVLVSDDQLYLAIGKRGQNVRLASRLTGWNVRVYRHSEYGDEHTPAICVIEGVDTDLGRRLAGAGFNTIKTLAEAVVEDVAAAGSLDPARAEAVIEAARRHLHATEGQAE